MRRLALVLVSAGVLMLVVGLVLPPTEETGRVLPSAFGTFALAYVAVGGLVAYRRPEHAVGWWMLSAGVLMCLSVLAGQYAGYVLYGGGGRLPGAPYAALVSNLAFLPAFGVLACLLLSFPSGRLPGWRGALAGVALLASGAAALAQAVQPGTLDGFPGTGNPLGVDRAAAVATAAFALSGGLTLGIGAFAVGSIFGRLRTTRGDEREQLKWLAYAAALLLAGFGLNALPVGLDDSWLGLLPIVLGMFAMPLSIGVAVLRFRLYDIDVVVKRTLVYGSLTAVLLATYLGLVLVLRVVLSPVAGKSDLAVAGSTLAVAALFRPLRTRLQAVVDQRFYRSRYDASRTAEAFARRLRQEVDLDSVVTDLRRVVAETVAPTEVSLWLRS